MDFETKVLIILVNILLIVAAFHCGTEYGRYNTLREVKYAKR